jgi:hypothetical protein
MENTFKSSEPRVLLLSDYGVTADEIRSSYPKVFLPRLRVVHPSVFVVGISPKDDTETESQIN